MFRQMVQTIFPPKKTCRPRRVSGATGVQSVYKNKSDGNTTWSSRLPSGGSATPSAYRHSRTYRRERVLGR